MKNIFCCAIFLFAFTSCSEEGSGRQNADAYCYMLEQCQLGDYQVCYDSTSDALAAEPNEECRAARKLQLDCLGHLDCIEYVQWSQSQTGSGTTYPCSSQDELVAYTCTEQ